jgi:hypothetical protein
MIKLCKRYYKRVRIKTCKKQWSMYKICINILVYAHVSQKYTLAANQLEKSGMCCTDKVSVVMYVHIQQSS